MDIRLLEAFRAVLESGSVTQAAAVLGVTQPAVSAQLTRLESELGFALFERSGNRLRPTSEAIVFRGEVDRTLDHLDELDRAVEEIRAGQVGSVTVAALPMASLTLLPPVVAAFARQRPRVTVQLFTRNSDIVRGMFPSRTHDIGIAEMPVDPSGLRVHRYRMDCVAVLPKDHALAAHKILTPELMSGVPFVGMSREWAAYHAITPVFAEAGARLNTVAVSELFAVCCALVASGVGVSIVDPATAEQFAHAGVAVRPFRPAVPYDIALFHSADRDLSLPARSLVQAFDQHVRRFVSFDEDVA
jgi:DNA-binding transcriptional LysR family regulator